MIAALHQPNFLPYLGFFDKMKKADLFLIRDEVLFVRKEYHQRNKIRINSNDNLNHPQSKWLKVPVFEQEDYIMNIGIDNRFLAGGKPWRENMLHEVKASYHGSIYFSEYFQGFSDIISGVDAGLLSLNMKLIDFLRTKFDIDTKIVLASKLGLKDAHYQKTDASLDIIDICKEVGAKTYLSGIGGKDYLDLKRFEEEGIKVDFQEYVHPTYKQRYPGFVSYMCALDALFNVGRFPEV